MRLSLVYDGKVSTMTERSRRQIIATEMRFLRNIEGIIRRQNYTKETLTNQ